MSASLGHKKIEPLAPAWYEVRIRLGTAFSQKESMNSKPHEAHGLPDDTHTQQWMGSINIIIIYLGCV